MSKLNKPLELIFSLGNQALNVRNIEDFNKLSQNTINLPYNLTTDLTEKSK